MQKKFKGPKRTLACSGALYAERILNVDLKDLPYLKNSPWLCKLSRLLTLSVMRTIKFLTVLHGTTGPV